MLTLVFETSSIKIWNWRFPVVTGFGDDTGLKVLNRSMGPAIRMRMIERKRPP